MPLEDVRVEAGGRLLFVKQVTVTAGAERAVRTAKVLLAPESLQAGLGVRWGEPAVVTAGGEPIVTGFVRDINASHDAENHEVTIGIASKTVDETECGIDHKTGHVEKVTLKQILTEYGSQLDIVETGEMEVVPYHQAEPEETRFQTVERIARRQGVVLHDDGDGRLVLASAPEGRHEGGLALGVNIAAAAASYSEQGRYSRTIVKGQSSKGHGAAVLRLKATATDSEVTRDRVKVIVLEADATEDAVKRRADTRRRRAAGRSVSAQVTTPGWRDRAGKLWQVNYLVYVDDPAIGMAQDLVIQSVTFTQGDRTTAQLTLVDPRALGGEDPKGKSKGKTGVDTAGAIVEVEP